MSYDTALLNQIWQKASPLPNSDADMWRKDDYGRMIKYTDYGKRDSEYGWEVDHIQRVADGGLDILSNLRPLNWQSNVDRG